MSFFAFEKGPGWELRLGAWQETLAAYHCDAVICDPPYGERTHASRSTRHDKRDTSGQAPSYAAITDADVFAFVESWAPRCRGWFVALTDSDMIGTWRAAYDKSGLYSFAPVPCVMRGMSVRLQGDGPSSWSVYAMVARPKNKAMATWGTLDGAYVGSPSREAGGGRGKPEWLMGALIRDYSRPGQVVCDPFAGWGTTLAAAVQHGRTAIGAEIDRAAFIEARRRLQRPQQIDLLTDLQLGGRDV